MALLPKHTERPTARPPPQSNLANTTRPRPCSAVRSEEQTQSGHTDEATGFAVALVVLVILAWHVIFAAVVFIAQAIFAVIVLGLILWAAVTMLLDA